MSNRPPLRRVQQKCSVRTCYYSKFRHEDGDDVSYFRLPKDPVRAKLWLDAIGRDSDVPRVTVCANHFASNFISLGVATRYAHLVATAVPTLNLPQPGDPPHSEPRAPTPPPPAPVDPRDSLPTVPGPSSLHPASSSPGSHFEFIVKHEPDDDNDIKLEIFVKEETIVQEKRIYDEAKPDPCSLPEPPIKRKRPDEHEDATVTRQAELDRLVELSRAHLEPELAKYIEAKVHQQTDGRGKRVDENLALFALKLFHAFPQTYRLMQKALGLPSLVQVRRVSRPLRGEGTPLWARLLCARFSGAAAAARACVVCVMRAPLRPALAYDAARDRLCGLLAGQPARDHLYELPAGQPARDRLCGLPAGQPACHVALLLARGLHQHWCQPLACRLLPARYDAEELRLWIVSVVIRLFRIGLDVHALVTDFDDDFVPTGPIVPTESPDFTVGDKRVHCFYDYTQSIVSLRDHFAWYDIKIEDQTATWEVIRELHEYNGTWRHPLPTGLTDGHLAPPPAGAGRPPLVRRARLAEEALSRRVAAALGTAAELRLLPDAARATARLVATVADLVELMHTELGPNVSPVETRTFGSLIRRLKSTSLRCKQSERPVRDPGLLAALRAGVHGAAALLGRARGAGAGLALRALTNDPLHEFLDGVRARHGGDAPTPMQTLAAFERSFAFNVTRPLRSSREDGRLEEFLSAAREMRDVPRSAPAAPAPAALLPPGERARGGWTGARGRRVARVPLRRLLAGCLRVHGGCAAARAFCRAKPPPETLLRYLRLMSKEFCSRAQRALSEPTGLLRSLLADRPFEAPCPCFPTLYLRTMFFHFQIQALITFNNEIYERDPDAELSITTAHIDIHGDK